MQQCHREQRQLRAGLLAAARRGRGRLMDTNMTPPQGVFVDFSVFCVPASGLA
jgi:hypothetical protein